MMKLKWEKFDKIFERDKKISQKSEIFGHSLLKKKILINLIKVEFRDDKDYQLLIKFTQF